MLTFPSRSRDFVKAFLCGYLIIVTSLAWGDARPATQRPNIVLIMSDDMGFSDIGCYGGEVDTPSLDQLAANGVRFTQFYNTGRCCPTRASLLTGLYPHQTNMGWMTGNRHLPGYQGEIGQNCVTIAEVLKPAGYRTYMTGKWHVCRDIDPNGPKYNWPLQRGFEKFYGTITGAGSFYDPTCLCRGNTYITPDNDPEYQPETFYYTDAISENAVAFLKQHEANNDNVPFFIYVAFTAAHWPMHALPEDIAKYDGKYDDGYEPIRIARLKRMQQMGLIDPKWQLSRQAGDWDTTKHKEWESALMEVYAAMIHRMDFGIGRIVAELERQNVIDDTLILFLQDNGGCAEGMGRSENVNEKWGQVKIQPSDRDTLQPHIWPPMQTRDGRPVLGGPQKMPGPADSYHGYGRAWANVSNTPFREYKHWVHEGGISTPLIAHWPTCIPSTRRNRLEHQPAHLIDIMATVVDVANASYPAARNGKQIKPYEGVSLVPAFLGRPLNRTNPIFWEHEGNRAIRKDRWKLVAKGAYSDWELYDMQADRTETNNLVGKHPQLAKQMASEWEVWAQRANVKPWPWKKEATNNTKISDASRFDLKQGDILKDGSPDTGRRAFRVSIEILKPGTGVILAQGGVTHGWAIYTDPESESLSVCFRRGGKLETLSSESKQPSAPYTLSLQLAPDGRLLLRRDTVTDRHQLIDQQTAGGLLHKTALDPLCVGLDNNDPVGDYPRSFAYSGEIGAVSLQLNAAQETTPE
jgi:arylsulfatase A-like enzyme